MTVLPLSYNSSVAVAGGCKAGGANPTSVVGTALVIENSTQATAHPLKAEADCLLEGSNTYQVGVMWCDVPCTVQQGAVGAHSAELGEASYAISDILHICMTLDS